ncbi:MAG: hypothetical protein JKY08_07025 [Flavobacteriaceae bacterium]|nr:hypothetical protein [Flavobacteriaceae bacterium]
MSVLNISKYTYFFYDYFIDFSIKRTFAYKSQKLKANGTRNNSSNTAINAIIDEVK